MVGLHPGRQFFFPRYAESVKVLVKHLRSGLFLDNDGRWTSRKEKVRDFGSTEKARRFRETHYCDRGTATVIRFANTRHDIQLSARV